MGAVFQEGKPVFSYTFADGSNYRAVSANPVPAGKHAVVMNFSYDGGGMGKSGTAIILVDGIEVATVRVVKTIPFRFSTEETLDFARTPGRRWICLTMCRSNSRARSARS